MLHKRHLTTVAVVISTVLLMAGPATAMMLRGPQRAPIQTASSQPTSVPLTASASTHGSSAFDWGDAAIGAGVVIVVMLLVGGGLRATTHRPRPRLAHTA